MTETIAHPDAHEPPRIPPKPLTDAAAVKWNTDALSHAHERAINILQGRAKVLAILDNFASRDMPGRQSGIQDTVHKILAAVGAALPPPADPELRWRRTNYGPRGRTA